MNEVFPATFYSATARPAPERRTLLQDIETEVCVVGGGFAGLWAARALAARGKEVVLLEAGEVAGEASGQNGGFVSAGYAERIEKITRRVGLEQARELYRLSREGVEMVRAFLAEGDFGLDPVPGRLNVLRYDDEVSLRDQAEALARDFDHDVVVWPKERVREVLASGRYYQALHEADAFHLHPLNLARALAADFEARGGTIYEQSRVRAADLSGLRKSLWTDHGRVRAFEVVLAGSAFLGEAFPAFADTVLPVRTHVVVTAPLGEVLHEAIRYPGAISDTRRAGDYYRVVGDRLLWGGRISTNLKPPKDLAEVMAADIASVYPQLRGAPIEYAWSGTMGYAVHKMPQIGLAQPGVWIASAFGGHGLNTTAIAGELIAAAMVEQDDRWRLFIPFGLVWAGGNVGRVATQASYWSMQFNDWMDEAQTKRVEQVQADIAAGLAPGLAAHAARRAKHKFVESHAGRASARFAAALYFALNRLLVGLRWAGAIIYAISAAVGRLLYVVIMAVATVIGFVAGWVGWGMEMVAAGIVLCARAIGWTAVLFWRGAVVPVSLRVASAARWAWRTSKLGSTRFANAIGAGARWIAEGIKAGAISTGNRIRESAIFAAARTKEGVMWSGARIQDGAQWTAAQAKAGATAAAERGKQAALLSSARTREGALWTAARAKNGAQWTATQVKTGAATAAEHGKRAALFSGARAREGALWIAANAKYGVQWTAAQIKAGVKVAAERGAQAARSSGTRAREGALGAAVRAKEAAAWSAQKVATGGRFAWGRAIVPGAQGAAVGASQAAGHIKVGSTRLAGHARENARSFGAWIATLPGIVWNVLLLPAAKYVLDRASSAKEAVIDARKRHAEVTRMADAARKDSGQAAQSRAGTGPDLKETAEKKADAAPVSAGQEPHAKSKKKKAKQDSVEV
ncbi:MAG TPA: FAD-binding oxidoreductase [Xanthobacteraceae bacterium]|nr:FAD-binding oxidoreductase [Xanthobacteraceae bacterium]